MFAARSGCVYSTPVSVTATTTDDEPVVTLHAGTASSSAPAVPAVPLTLCPVFCRAHCKPNDGSFGTPAASST